MIRSQGVPDVAKASRSTGRKVGVPAEDEDALNGTTIYWGTADIEAEHTRLLKLGARVNIPINDVGGGIKITTVFDPFGNVVGIIENPHFKIEEIA